MHRQPRRPQMLKRLKAQIAGRLLACELVDGICAEGSPEKTALLERLLVRLPGQGLLRRAGDAAPLHMPGKLADVVHPPGHLRVVLVHIPAPAYLAFAIREDHPEVPSVGKGKQRPVIGVNKANGLFLAHFRFLPSANSRRYFTNGVPVSSSTTSAS